MSVGYVAQLKDVFTKMKLMFTAQFLGAAHFQQTPNFTASKVLNKGKISCFPGGTVDTVGAAL